MTATICLRNSWSWLRASALSSTWSVTTFVASPPRMKPTLLVPRRPSLCDQAVPAVADQPGDGQRSDGDRADALLRRHAGMGRQALDLDLQAISAGGGDGDFLGRAAVPIEGQRRLAEQAQLHVIARRAGRLPPESARKTSAADAAACVAKISSAVLSTTATPERSSAPSPVLGSAERTTFPLRTGFEPTQIGTVSMWAISSRRAPRTVPGS